jgi:hypothetical protein
VKWGSDMSGERPCPICWRDWWRWIYRFSSLRVMCGGLLHREAAQYTSSTGRTRIDSATFDCRSRSRSTRPTVWLAQLRPYITISTRCKR